MDEQIKQIKTLEPNQTIKLDTDTLKYIKLWRYDYDLTAQLPLRRFEAQFNNLAKQRQYYSLTNDVKKEFLNKYFKNIPSFELVNEAWNYFYNYCDEQCVKFSLDNFFIWFNSKFSFVLKYYFTKNVFNRLLNLFFYYKGSEVKDYLEWFIKANMVSNSEEFINNTDPKKLASKKQQFYATALERVFNLNLSVYGFDSRPDLLNVDSDNLSVYGELAIKSYEAKRVINNKPDDTKLWVRRNTHEFYSTSYKVASFISENKSIKDILKHNIGVYDDLIKIAKQQAEIDYQLWLKKTNAKKHEAFRQLFKGKFKQTDHSENLLISVLKTELFRKGGQKLADEFDDKYLEYAN